MMIPQLPPAPDDESKQSNPTSLNWNGQKFPYSFPGLPPGVQLAALPPAVMPSGESGSYTGGYAFMLPQPAPAQKSPSGSSMVNGAPVYFCPPPMFVKGADGQSSMSPFITLPIDYSSFTSKRPTSNGDSIKPSKKRKSSTKSNGKEISGLHRSSSVGSNEGGLEMLIAAAAGDLDAETICA